ncbi:MAG: AbrB/MazE/SpoVT family DNA-binding domain-containing protein [Candidatus Thermoplasmatota archaeon]
MARCPICGKGKLQIGEIEEEMFGVSLGAYSAEICDECGETFLDQDAMQEIERKAKTLGVWGLAKSAKITKSGNSLSVRIPARIAQFLGLKEGKDIILYPDGKRKIILEVT